MSANPAAFAAASQQHLREGASQENAPSVSTVSSERVARPGFTSWTSQFSRWVWTVLKSDPDYTRGSWQATAQRVGASMIAVPVAVITAVADVVRGGLYLKWRKIGPVSPGAMLGQVFTPNKDVWLASAQKTREVVLQYGDKLRSNYNQVKTQPTNYLIKELSSVVHHILQVVVKEEDEILDPANIKAYLQHFKEGLEKVHANNRARFPDGAAGNRKESTIVGYVYGFFKELLFGAVANRLALLDTQEANPIILTYLTAEIIDDNACERLSKKVIEIQQEQSRIPSDEELVTEAQERLGSTPNTSSTSLEERGSSQSDSSGLGGWGCLPSVARLFGHTVPPEEKARKAQLAFIAQNTKKLDLVEQKIATYKADAITLQRRTERVNASIGRVQDGFDQLLKDEQATRVLLSNYISEHSKDASVANKLGSVREEFDALKNEISSDVLYDRLAKDGEVLDEKSNVLLEMKQKMGAFQNVSEAVQGQFNTLYDRITSVSDSLGDQLRKGEEIRTEWQKAIANGDTEQRARSLFKLRQEEGVGEGFTLIDKPDDANPDAIPDGSTASSSSSTTVISTNADPDQAATIPVAHENVS